MFLIYATLIFSIITSLLGYADLANKSFEVFTFLIGMLVLNGLIIVITHGVIQWIRKTFNGSQRVVSQPPQSDPQPSAIHEPAPRDPSS